MVAITGGRTNPALVDIDLADPAFWERPLPERMAAFARLRQLDQPVFFPEHKGTASGAGRGFYALVRHADVVEASKNPKVFSSQPAVTTPAPPRWVKLLFGESMVNMDDPRHVRLRRIVSRAFTPRVLAKIDEDLAQAATQIVDEVIAQRPGNFVTAVAGQMPFRIICDMMGIPAEYRPLILSRVNHTTEYIGVKPNLTRRVRRAGGSTKAMLELQRLVIRLGKERRGQPGDDLITALVNANVEGKYLTPRELGSFFSLLLVAGIETTRNTIAHGLKLLTDHPEQRELLQSDFDRHIATAIEEIVRYATPIIQFRRTLTCDYQMNGHHFARGDTVVLFYNSANRDEAVFTNPDTFDITRNPNPHVGFGGPGPHICLGTFLARKEIRALFRELLTRLPDIHSVGEPELIASNFDHRVRSLRFDFTRP
jgi:cytochrome P450